MSTSNVTRNATSELVTPSRQTRKSRFTVYKINIPYESFRGSWPPISHKNCICAKIQCRIKTEGWESHHVSDVVVQVEMCCSASLRLDGGVTSVLVWKCHTLLQRCATLGYVVAIAALSTNQPTERTQFPMSTRADALPSNTPTHFNALKRRKVEFWTSYWVFDWFMNINSQLKQIRSSYASWINRQRRISIFYNRLICNKHSLYCISK